MKNSNPSKTEIDVELYRDPKPGREENLLVVNQGKHHHAFDKAASDDQPHTITWTLTGNASGGEFCAEDDPDSPGFSWLVRTPSDKVFRNLRYEGRNKISIDNYHSDKSSEGVWHYQLFARFGDKVYGVPLTFVCGESNSPHPSIKNN